MDNETDDKSKAVENAENADEGVEAANGAGEGDAAKGAGAANGEPLTDRHGQDAIARGKYERDIKARDERIAELEAKVEEASKTEESRKALQAEIAKLREEASERDTDHALELAGCVNLKAAKAVLADHEGDVGKLKEACPYLFQQEKKGSTGLKPTGAARGDDDDEKLDRAFGIKKKG